jgi:uncharacterized protein (DUF488 family)
MLQFEGGEVTNLPSLFQLEITKALLVGLRKHQCGNCEVNIWEFAFQKLRLNLLGTLGMRCLHLSKGGKIESNLFGVLTYDLFLSKYPNGYVGEVVGWLICEN